VILVNDILLEDLLKMERFQKMHGTTNFFMNLMEENTQLSLLVLMALRVEKRLMLI
jgi:hypothetical protein